MKAREQNWAERDRAKDRALRRYNEAVEAQDWARAQRAANVLWELARRAANAILDKEAAK